jgi:predicted RNase H-like nuclease
MFLGIDSYPAGWLVASMSRDMDCKFSVMTDIRELHKYLPQAELILIDIPIGLPLNKDRDCDRLARRILKHRASSVFAAPVRKVLQAMDYKEACRINQRILGKKISIQTWNILPKIKEVDHFLSTLEPNRRFIIRESFPELGFWALFAGRIMQHRKKTEPGFMERVEVLESYWPGATSSIEEALQTFPRKQVSNDDIVDALILALNAACGADSLMSIPDLPPRDEHDLPMEMVFCKKHLPLDVIYTWQEFSDF